MNPYYKPDLVRKAFVRGLLASRLWKFKDLGRAAGMKADVCRQVCAGQVNHLARIRVENALNSPIWSTIEAFNMRRSVAAFYGIDLALLTVSQLTDKARELRIADEIPARREELLTLLQQHFEKCAGVAGASNPHPTQ